MHTKPILIGIVDDHYLIREGIRETLNNDTANFQIIVEADNGHSFIEQLKTLRTLPDVCLLDINMPVMNGYETLRQLKLHYPFIKALVLTVLSTDYAITKTIMNGAMGYITKHCSLKQLAEAIVTVHSGNYYYSSDISQETIKKIRSKLIPAITDKEMQFLSLCCKDISYKDIAASMNVG
ncbi:MAG TPA: response regulator transcription factor, partial [Candidatus Babeliaceae bacterium]|nr:response regulator transcription factor [Candidatus Babeliaceae bacterium]